MNRYLLDTNILGYLFGDVDCLSSEVYTILNDVESLLAWLRLRSASCGFDA